jgi:S-adenosylmethionine:tRNA ribosyltransferase-isomerase
MRADLFDYELPEDLIAQQPPPSRAGARLMVLREGVAHATIPDLPSLLPPNALVVVNDTKVRHARLITKKSSGGRAEIFLLRPMGSSWLAMGRASKAFRFPSELEVVGPKGEPTPMRVRLEKQLDGGLLEVSIVCEGSPDDAIERWGRVPLPPYIKRDPSPDDADRYQTVFARSLGAVAAPTAGLHLSAELLARLDVAHVTLHVGLGTFQPVTADDFDDHAMHAEAFEISEDAARRISDARSEGRPIVAVGTTVVRALESHAMGITGETRLLIQPGFAFKAVDVLLTNFHLPRSTLLALVCAFAGRERVMRAYADAVRERYRFFSYGDAMLVWPDATVH